MVVMFRTAPAAPLGTEVHGAVAVGYGCSCAGYIGGAALSDECPAGSVRIESEAACRTAAAAVGKTFCCVLARSYLPRGCYYDTYGNNAAFNNVAVGAGHAQAKLLCAEGTTSAPPCAHRARI